MRLLSFINLAGVLALGVLCVAQWRGNRELNMELARLEGIRIDQSAKLDERDRSIGGQRRDIEALQAQVLSLTDSLRGCEGRLALEERLHSLAVSERDQLKDSIAKWAQAVETRDARIGENHEKIRELAERLSEVVTRHNEIAASYNDVVKLLNERTNDYNELVRQFNESKKQ